MAADVSSPSSATSSTLLIVLGRLWQRMFGWMANPLAAKEMLARMRGPRTFVIATLELLPLAAIASSFYIMVANASTARHRRQRADWPALLRRDHRRRAGADLPAGPRLDR